MNISVDRKEFINALAIGSAMSGKNSTMPILCFTKIAVEGNLISISSFDLECAITTRIYSLSNDGNGGFCVNAGDLLKALKSLNSDTVEMDINVSQLSIKHKSGIMEMPIVEANAFPDISEGHKDNSHLFVLSTEWLKEWVSIGRNFASTDEFRVIMNGLYMNITSSYVEVCATDAHKLYTDKIVAPMTDGTNVEAVLPSRAFTPLLNFLTNEAEVTMRIDDKNFTFTTPQTELKCRKVEGNYPNFRAVIPSHSQKLVMNNEAFATAVNRVAIFSNKETSLVKLNILKNSVLLEGNDIDFNMSSSESVDATLNSDSFVSIGAKAIFLSLCLKNIFSDEVTMEYGTSAQPMLFKDSSRPSKQILLMPMMIQ